MDDNTNWLKICNFNIISNYIINKNENISKIKEENETEDKKIDSFNIEKILDEYPNKLNTFNSLELLKIQADLSSNLNKYYFNFNNNNQEIILKILDKLLEISKILKKRLNMNSINIKYNLINNTNLPRSSYKFCVHKDACKYNYLNADKKGCFAHHFVHNLIEFDINIIIYYIKNFISDKNLNNNQEIIKSFTTLNYVIKHMYEELNSIFLYKNSKEDIEKFHKVNFRKKNKKYRQPLV